jgi:hypothetical protein
MLVIAGVLGCGSAATPVAAPGIENKPVVDPVVPVATSPARGLQFKVVDNDTPYMRKLHDHAAAADPIAAAAGISAHKDFWGDSSEQIHVDHYLTASDREGTTGRATLERYVSALATKQSAFKLPADHELGFELTAPGTWRTYYLFKAVELDGTAVRDAKVFIDPDSNRPVVLLELTKAGGETFATLTTRIVGKKLATLLGGTIKSAPIIEAPITEGRAKIQMGGSDLTAMEREAAALVDVLVAQPKP